MMIRHIRNGKWTAQCGCEFASRAEADAHDAFECASRQALSAASAIGWMAAAMLVSTVVVLWRVLA